MFKTNTLRSFFNLSSLKSKGLTLAIEHSPCCVLSFAAGFIGLPVLNHNPTIELGFAVGGAIAGEYIGHKLFHKEAHSEKSNRSLVDNVRGYSFSLLFGLSSWGIHQKLFHHHHHHAEEVSSKSSSRDNKKILSPALGPI